MELTINYFKLESKHISGNFVLGSAMYIANCVLICVKLLGTLHHHHKLRIILIAYAEFIPLNFSTIKDYTTIK